MLNWRRSGRILLQNGRVMYCPIDTDDQGNPLNHCPCCLSYIIVIKCQANGTLPPGYKPFQNLWIVCYSSTLNMFYWQQTDQWLNFNKFYQNLQGIFQIVELSNLQIGDYPTYFRTEEYAQKVLDNIGVEELKQAMEKACRCVPQIIAQQSGGEQGSDFDLTPYKIDQIETIINSSSEIIDELVSNLNSFGPSYEELIKIKDDIFKLNNQLLKKKNQIDNLKLQKKDKEKKINELQKTNKDGVNDQSIEKLQKEIKNIQDEIEECILQYENTVDEINEKKDTMLDNGVAFVENKDDAISLMEQYIEQLEQMLQLESQLIQSKESELESAINRIGDYTELLEELADVIESKEIDDFSENWQQFSNVSNNFINDIDDCFNSYQEFYDLVIEMKREFFNGSLSVGKLILFATYPGHRWKIVGKIDVQPVKQGMISSNGILLGLPDSVKVPAQDTYGLLTGCELQDGTIIWPPWSRYHIYWYTDGGQHPSCVGLKVDGSASYSTNIFSGDRSKISGAITFTQKGPFNATVYLRWNSGHDPYPQIDDISVWCFGVETISKPFPMQDGDNEAWTKVGSIRVTSQGEVYVNGNYIGIMQEFIKTE